MGRWRGRAQSAGDLVALLPAYLALGLLKHIVPIPSLAKHLWRDGPAARDRAREQRTIANVVRISQWSGRMDRDCLQRSLLLYRELSRAGGDPRLWVGFRRPDRRIEGHAWVSVDGGVITEASPGEHQFEAAFGFGPRGTAVPIATRAPRARSASNGATA